MYMSKKPPPPPRKSKRKKTRKRKRRHEGPSVAASALIAASGLPMEAQYPVSRRLELQYESDDAVDIPQRSNSARTTSSSLSELAAIHDSNPESYQEYLDNKKNTKGTNTYARVDEQGDVIMGGRKTRRKKRRRKRKTKRKKRRRKRKTKKRRK